MNHPSQQQLYLSFYVFKIQLNPFLLNTFFYQNKCDFENRCSGLFGSTWKVHLADLSVLTHPMTVLLRRGEEIIGCFESLKEQNICVE